MQSNEKPASNGTGELPSLGPNKIAQAMDDYDNMANELQRTKVELLKEIALGRELLAENQAVRNQMQVQTDFLIQQVDAANTRAHILGATLTALRTNYSTIREIFTRCETEALAAGIEAAAVVPEQSLPEEQHEAPEAPPETSEELPKPFAKEDDLETMHEPPKIDRRSPAPYQT